MRVLFSDIYDHMIDLIKILIQLLRALQMLLEQLQMIGVLMLRELVYHGQITHIIKNKFTLRFNNNSVIFLD